MSASKVAVIGAGGKTGALVVEGCLRDGISTVAIVRNPSKYADKWSKSDRLQVLAGDVLDLEGLKTALHGCTHVVFAAMASEYFGAKDVDFQGVKNTAEAAQLGAHVILITSALVTPTNRFHPMRVLLNTVKWYLMDYKFKGEEALKSASHVKHTIIRPGGLTNDPAGKSKIVVSQGDKLWWPGMIPRGDLAAVVLAAINDSKSLQKTVEVQADKKKPPLDDELKHLFDSTQS